MMHVQLSAYRVMIMLSLKVWATTHKLAHAKVPYQKAGVFLITRPPRDRRISATIIPVKPDSLLASCGSEVIQYRFIDLVSKSAPLDSQSVARSFCGRLYDTFRGCDEVRLSFQLAGQTASLPSCEAYLAFSPDQFCSGVAAGSTVTIVGQLRSIVGSQSNCDHHCMITIDLLSYIGASDSGQYANGMLRIYDTSTIGPDRAPGIDYSELFSLSQSIRLKAHRVDDEIRDEIIHTLGDVESILFDSMQKWLVNTVNDH